VFTDNFIGFGRIPSRAQRHTVMRVTAYRSERSLSLKYSLWLVILGSGSGDQKKRATGCDQINDFA
jgi:hypothetical protein